QICNGLIDCDNGEDEQWCDQLEITKCNKNEYRCHYGGQCIPLEFNRDSHLNIDCLDGSDEDDWMSLPPRMNDFCGSEFTFDCQEHIGRYTETIPCGDGQYLNGVIIPNKRSYCYNKKDKLLGQTILTSMNHIVNKNCRRAFYCILRLRQTFDINVFQSTVNVQSNENTQDCESLSKHCSSEWLVIPARPIFLDFFQFVYLTNRSMDLFQNNIAPDFVCFNPKKCSILAMTVVPIEIIKKLMCCHVSNLTKMMVIEDFYAAARIFSYARQQCLTMGNEKSCKNSSYFYCNQSMKCISKYRVQDGKVDCFYREDELFNTCQWNDSNRFQCSSDSSKCLSFVAVNNFNDDCPSGEDEAWPKIQDVTIETPFHKICDFLQTVSLSEKNNETDETNCDLWPCANPYTRCNNNYDCLDISDEFNCPDSVCPFNQYECFDKSTGSVYCLSRNNLYDKYLDPCQRQMESLTRKVYFYDGTLNISDNYFSWKNVPCLTVDKLCPMGYDFEVALYKEDVCPIYTNPYISIYFRGYVINFQNNKQLCYMRKEASSKKVMFVIAQRLGNYPPLSSTSSSVRNILDVNEKQQNILTINNKDILYCHRGILVLHGRNATKKCFCPSTHFGDRCQWQNQRISLTLQFSWLTFESLNIAFQIIILLIDGDGHIAPYYERLTYGPSYDCFKKYNIYLLYPQRPKSLSKNYSIHINVYRKSDLLYWGSWYLSIPFAFLPVNRISTKLLIPEVPNNSPCPLYCGKHGKCMRYINKHSLFFCHCDKGYSGMYCNISHKCNCANDSICLASSICVCPLYKFGVHCYINHPISQLTINSSHHNRLCIPNDDRIDLTTYNCLCTSDYSGKHCENRNNRISIHLNEIFSFTISRIFLHFVIMHDSEHHMRITIIKKVPFDHQNLTFYAPQPFNVLILQIPNSQRYYLTVLREQHSHSEDIYTEIQSNYYCRHIKELFNSTFVQYQYLRRVKYYPLLCRQNSQLKCFYDDDNLMCICDLDRFSNCFRFNNTNIDSCSDHNLCQNGGQCFENNDRCPTRLTCICPDCFYGVKCQLSTSSFMFSLDPILGYHIQPNVAINRQPSIIRITIATSIVFFIGGLVNGCLSILIFVRKKPRQVGTGNYLLSSSIAAIFMFFILTYKFWQLMFDQIFTIDNRRFLTLNCIILDVILKILLATTEWLNACVAIERAISVKQSTNFNKNKSKQMSKRVITVVIILIIITHIHDPIYRELIDDLDIDQKRIWCLVQYNYFVNIYNIFITLFHFLAPFSINLISSIWLIITLARTRANLKRSKKYQEHIKQLLEQHRHLLIAPCSLILLSSPRLIISFVSGCMRSERQPWIHLIGYYISFIPSMSTFIVFVLPSENYKNEFHGAIQDIIKRFPRFLRQN
ncbi:unnamed protein product, partial [Adineta ricciae]